jgi:hypothetical protein
VTLEHVAESVRRRRFRFVDEAQLQTGLAQALEADGFAVEREVRLGARDRLDLLVDGVAIEVKVAGGAVDVARQLARYARHDRVEALLLVTSRVRHVQVPRELGGKPLEIVALAGTAL